MSSFLPQKVQQHNQKDCHLLAEIKVHNETDPPQSVHNITDPPQSVHNITDPPQSVHNITDPCPQYNWPPTKCPQYNWQFQVQVCFFAARGAVTQQKRLLPPRWEDQCSVVAHIALPKETAGRCVLHPLCPCHPHPGPAAPHVPCTSNVKEYL